MRTARAVLERTIMSNEFKRQAIAARRIGRHSSCVRCGEDRPGALIRNSEPRICACCQRKEAGKSVIDDHHVAGRNNHCATVPVPVNDHRACLSLDQYGWPRRTLRNPDRSPLLAIAACIRGFIAFLEYCVEQLLRWAPQELEGLDQYLTEKIGPRWWRRDRVYGRRRRGCRG